MNDMVDMSQFVEAKSDQLNADDLMGRTLTITVTRVTGSDSSEQPVIIHYEGDNGKPFKPCKTMRRVLLGVWGKHASEYVGRSMTLYRDDSVSFGGLQTGGTRISHMSHIDGEKVIVVNKTRGKKAGIKIKPLQLDQRQTKPADPNAAEKWATDHIGFVVGAADLERLAAIQASGKKAMDKLAGTNPELHAKVTAAYAARHAELSADESFATPDTPADDPFAGDGGDVDGEEG
jgi:hypothetical protein